MIKYYWTLMIILSIQHQVFLRSANAQQKISAIRDKFKEDIQNIPIRPNTEDPQDFIDNYDLIFTEPAEVTSVTTDKPILRVGHRHGHRGRKHRLRKTDVRDPPRTGAEPNETITTNDPEILTTVEDNAQTSTTTSIPTKDTFETNVKLLQEKVEAAIKNLTDYISLADTEIPQERIPTIKPILRKMNDKVSKAVPFYRRFNYLKDSERIKPQKWVHCLDLISPRLQGMTDDGPTVVTHAHGDVKRLAHLLYTDVSKFSSQDMVSILTQISKIRIRMYMWSQTAISTILNIIIKGPVHSFKTLKIGIKKLFDAWHLDTSMLPIFLKQTRIFRPPCIDISGRSGFTKRPGGVHMYTKPDKPQKMTHNPDKSCHSREDHIKYNNENPVLKKNGP